MKVLKITLGFLITFLLGVIATLLLVDKIDVVYPYIA